MLTNLKSAFRYAIIFSVISVFAYLVSFPYLIPVSQMSVDKLNLSGTVVTLSQYLLAAGLNFVLNTFIFSMIGLLLVDRVQLRLNWIRAFVDRKEKPTWDNKYVILAVGWGAISSFIISLLIWFVFEPLIPQMAAMNRELADDMAWWAGISTIFQGGIVEELLMRLGVMTIIIWIFTQIFAGRRAIIPSWIYWLGIVASALFFGLGHLPVAQSTFGTLTPLIVSYVLIGNSLAGLGFGYLYWKKGLEYGIIAHMTSDFFLHFAFAPFL